MTPYKVPISASVRATLSACEEPAWDDLGRPREMPGRRLGADDSGYLVVILSRHATRLEVRTEDEHELLVRWLTYWRERAEMGVPDQEFPSRRHAAGLWRLLQRVTRAGLA